MDIEVSHRSRFAESAVSKPGLRRYRIERRSVVFLGLESGWYRGIMPSSLFVDGGFFYLSPAYRGGGFPKEKQRVKTPTSKIAKQF